MTETLESISQIEPIAKLDKDIKSAARLLGKREARYLVDQYYVIQDNRIRADAQVRAFTQSGEPNRLILWEADNQRRFENNIKSALDVFGMEYRVGQWLRSICGIGPVITAGLLAHLDISKAKTFGHFWNFAGLNPLAKWEKGKKRPWNATLKSLLVFKAGESFVKVQGNKKDVYGKLFAARKAKEWDMNLAGTFAQDANTKLNEKAIGDDTSAKKWYSGRVDPVWAKETLDAGLSFPMPLPARAFLPDDKYFPMLPPAVIHARARRYAVKLFVAHLHHIMYEDFYEQQPPDPWVFVKGQGDHRHIIKPPNWPCEVTGKKLREMLE